MVGDIADNNLDFPRTIISDVQVIKIVSAGFLTVNAFAGDIQAFHFGITARQQMLLHIHRQTKRLAHPVPFFETFCHFIDDVTRITDFIIGRDLYFLVKVAVSNAAQALDDLTKRKC